MFSLKMRASKDGVHVSGAERISTENKIEEIANSLIKRALFHENGTPDTINLKLEKITSEITYLKHIPIKTLISNNKETSRNISRNILRKELEVYFLKNGKDFGKIDILIDTAFEIIDKGNMRGAAVLDLDGNRLEEDTEKGVRVKNIDTSEELKSKILADSKLTDRTIDAIAIATKVLNFGFIAEICTSDNYSYNIGYVATKSGYFRIPNLKNEGEFGGRVFFIENSANIEEIFEKIEKTPVIVY
ncbi:6-carboxyhexanoate--CoA ligase [Methanococcus vannielii SB]|uniref:6-carboxyhexanoate--CoA ligase n=1 Tax=Methanococcus vannielii (strain ATCC 35089 / DSM 1224 / JCM 13029 / OCM 148 / SB) TaxID=406327 RepID=BIOW_METVS|nr:6-carboxyhexanoate--CoA ligase [Methanococcus vannielii]A6UQM0.1 RecName: Full=6-carboxyhexanoate--CoA ligase; AltName: Full=Pimeloyl-CoA synthase [Methanococcus vannielii SB]ABR54792.1 6-carboxyhexanoate--CoA ligase [Methanococcus vannielii SB]